MCWSNLCTIVHTSFPILASCYLCFLQQFHFYFHAIHVFIDLHKIQKLQVQENIQYSSFWVWSKLLTMVISNCVNFSSENLCSLCRKKSLLGTYTTFTLKTSDNQFSVWSQSLAVPWPTLLWVNAGSHHWEINLKTWI